MKNKKQTPEEEETPEEAEEAAANEGAADFAAIERANKAADRIEAALKKQEELFKKQEKLAVERALGGKGEAGTEKEPEKPEAPEEFAKRIQRGEVAVKDLLK